MTLLPGHTIAALALGRESDVRPLPRRRDLSLHCKDATIGALTVGPRANHGAPPCRVSTLRGW
ncbi:MAG TPA: hypothetical protein VM580_28945, partial [Labilithrix sp.]|nr:hypothetical protein [Labilithrix sp.]